MITVKCAYSKNPTPDTQLYTFETADAVSEGDIVWTKDSRTGEHKNVMVVSIDAEYNQRALERFGKLQAVYKDKPVDLTLALSEGHRL